MLQDDNDNEIKNLNERSINAGNMVSSIFSSKFLYYKRKYFFKHDEDIKTIWFSGISRHLNLRFEEQSRLSCALSNQLYDPVETNAKNYKRISNNYREQRVHKGVNNQVVKRKARYIYN